MKRILGISLILGFICLAFFVGGTIGQLTFEPQVITEAHYYYLDRPVTVYEFVEKEVIKEVIVETVKEIEVSVEIPIYPGLEHWTSFHELYMWAVANAVEPMGKDMCLYEAMEMQKRAIADGKILSIEMLYEDTPRGHAVCSGIVFKKVGDELIPFIYTIKPTIGKPEIKATAPGIKLGGYYTSGDAYTEPAPQDEGKPDKPKKPKKPKK